MNDVQSMNVSPTRIDIFTNSKQKENYEKVFKEDIEKGYVKIETKSNEPKLIHHEVFDGKQNSVIGTLGVIVKSKTKEWYGITCAHNLLKFQ